jgi:hypothetical protein
LSQELNDGKIHTVIVCYHTNILYIYLDSNDFPIIIVNDINIEKLVKAKECYFGFTGATGGLNQIQDILSFEIYSKKEFNYKKGDKESLENFSNIKTIKTIIK